MEGEKEKNSEEKETSERQYRIPSPTDIFQGSQCENIRAYIKSFKHLMNAWGVPNKRWLATLVGYSDSETQDQFEKEFGMVRNVEWNKQIKENII